MSIFHGILHFSNAISSFTWMKNRNKQFSSTRVDPFLWSAPLPPPYPGLNPPLWSAPLTPSYPAHPTPDPSHPANYPDLLVQMTSRWRHTQRITGHVITWHQKIKLPCGIYPANTWQWRNIGLMLGQRCRRWTSIKPTLLGINWRVSQGDLLLKLKHIHAYVATAHARILTDIWMLTNLLWPRLRHKIALRICAPLSSVRWRYRRYRSFIIDWLIDWSIDRTHVFNIHGG